MTRRRIIAGVILLAVVAVAVPFAPGVWETVAYEDRMLGSFVVRMKRWDWLPGLTAYVPDQLCDSCRQQDHGECGRLGSARILIKTMIANLDNTRPPVNELADTELHELRAWYFGRLVGTTLPPWDFRCTCTDPSHDWER